MGTNAGNKTGLNGQHLAVKWDALQKKCARHMMELHARPRHKQDVLQTPAKQHSLQIKIKMAVLESRMAVQSSLKSQRTGWQHPSGADP